MRALAEGEQSHGGEEEGGPANWYGVVMIVTDHPNA